MAKKTLAVSTGTITLTSTQDDKAVDQEFSLEQAQKILDYHKRKKHAASVSWSIKEGQPFTVKDGKIIPTTERNVETESAAGTGNN